MDHFEIATEFLESIPNAFAIYTGENFQPLNVSKVTIPVITVSSDDHVRYFCPDDMKLLSPYLEMNIGKVGIKYLSHPKFVCPSPIRGGFAVFTHQLVF